MSDTTFEGGLSKLDNEDDIGFIPLDEAILAADSNANVPAEEYFKLSSHYNKLSISKVQAEHRARLAEAELVRQADLHKSMEENLLNRFTVLKNTSSIENDSIIGLKDSLQKQIHNLNQILDTVKESSGVDVESLRTLMENNANASSHNEEVAKENVQLKRALLFAEAEATEAKSRADAADSRADNILRTQSAADLSQILSLQQQLDSLMQDRRRMTMQLSSKIGLAPSFSVPEMSDIDAAVERSQSRLVEMLTTELTSLREKNQHLSVENDTLRTLSLRSSSLYAKDGQSTDDLQTKQEESEALISALTQEVESLTSTLASIQVGSASGSDGLLQELTKSKEAEGSLRAEVNELEHSLSKRDKIITRREEQLAQLREDAQRKLYEASEYINKLKADYAALRSAFSSVKQQGEEKLKKMHESLIRGRSQSATQRKAAVDAMKRGLESLREQLDQTRANAATTVAQIQDIATQSMNHLATQALAQEDEMLSLRENYNRELRLRKAIFNQLQELKGNIRVYARVRPLSEKERAEQGNANVVSFPKKGELVINHEAKKQRFPFEFEHVFPPSSSQEEVFEEVQDLVTSALDGYNVCIFAYGQTGSGKTFTMEGPKTNPGVNTRALEKLFSEATSPNSDWVYSLKVTLLEIYNEKVMDLLSDTQENLKIVQGKEGMEVPGITQVEVNSADDVQRWLAKGKKNRHVTKTDMNEHSSRSHLILSVYVAGTNTINGAVCSSKLHLIDLAGSERVSRSNVTGDALKEAQKINFSLSALGNVIAARANRSSHVPYRDSVLTYLLQDSLEKNSKTLMFVQLSPSLESFSETVSSLRFAERVKKVELGKANKNVSQTAIGGNFSQMEDE